MVEILKWVSYEFNNEAVERVILWEAMFLTKEIEKQTLNGKGKRNVSKTSRCLKRKLGSQNDD